MKNNVRIEEVGDINSDYPYLEVFLIGEISPFLEIAIYNRELSFKIYALEKDIVLSYKEWSFIQKIANEFLPRALKDEEDYNNYEL